MTKAYTVFSKASRDGAQFRTMEDALDFIIYPPEETPKPPAEPRVELTEAGEQLVVPGCERQIRRTGQQLNLWD